MKYNTFVSEKTATLNVAHQMVTAAKTAPKGCGTDKIVAFILDGEEKYQLCEEMKKMAVLPASGFFERDANNLNLSHCVVLIGVINVPLGLTTCGFCGFPNCAASVKAGSLCAFNTTDLGIAIGSAVSIAADHRIDNRVMFSIGKAALSLGLFEEDVHIAYGIPLSTGSKSIFFDREAASVLL